MNGAGVGVGVENILNVVEFGTRDGIEIEIANNWMFFLYFLLWKFDKVDRLPLFTFLIKKRFFVILNKLLICIFCVQKFVQIFIVIF